MDQIIHNKYIGCKVTSFRTNQELEAFFNHPNNRGVEIRHLFQNTQGKFVVIYRVHSKPIPKQEKVEVAEGTKTQEKPAEKPKPQKKGALAPK